MNDKASNSGKCFICNSNLIGTSIDLHPQNQATVEHFIPLWLLREGKMHRPEKGERYFLSNGVSIKGHPTIPCCKRCNDQLSMLEPRVQSLFSIKRLLNSDERQVMFLWLLKVAYGSAFRDFRANISNRNDIDRGKVISSRGFNRMQRFHKRVLREYCEKGNIDDLQLLPYSLLHAETSEKNLIFSKSIARNRVTVAWNGSAFRLALDNGEEESLFFSRRDPVIPAPEFDAFLASEDIFPVKSVKYPELKRGKQKTVVAKTRRLTEGDKVLIIKAQKTSDVEFKFFGHILDEGRIVGEENSVLIVVKRTHQDERSHLDEIEVYQPGLRLLTRTAAATLSFADVLGVEPEMLTPEREMVMLLFLIHEALKISFDINPTLRLGPGSIP